MTIASVQIESNATAREEALAAKAGIVTFRYPRTFDVTD
jgi:hypothetical protein